MDNKVSTGTSTSFPYPACEASRLESTYGLQSAINAIFQYGRDHYIDLNKREVQIDAYGDVYVFRLVRINENPGSTQPTAKESAALKPEVVA